MFERTCKAQVFFWKNAGIMLRDLKGQIVEEESGHGQHSTGTYFKNNFCISSLIIKHRTATLSHRKECQSNGAGLKSRQLIEADRADEDISYPEKQPLLHPAWTFNPSYLRKLNMLFSELTKDFRLKKPTKWIEKKQREAR